jgi:hypothetical protein
VLATRAYSEEQRCFRPRRVIGRCSDSSKGEASTGSSRPLESAALVEKQEPGRVLPLARPQGGLWFGRGHPRAFPTDVEAGARGITGAIGRNSEAGAIGRNSEACPELAASSLGLDDWPRCGKLN